MSLSARLQARQTARSARGERPEGRLAVRLRSREVGRDRERPEPGSRLRLPREIAGRALRSVEAGPNAPLLIRVVRYPYALQPGAASRVQGRPALDLSPPVRDRALVFRAVVADLIASVRWKSPLKGLSFGPTSRPHLKGGRADPGRPSPWRVRS